MNQTNKFLPRYIRFANQLQAQISRGELAPGEMLPPQRALAEQFGTTLMTIRKAINVLEEEGLIRSEHGVGTFIARPDLQEEQYQLLSLSSEMNQRSSEETETRLLHVDRATEHEQARQALKLPQKNLVSLLERLRIKNNTPFAYQRSYLPAKFADMLSTYTSNSSLYRLLQAETGQAMAMAKEYVIPIVLSSEQATHLQSKPGEPAWLSIRLSSTQDGVPLIYDEAILKHDSFVITVDHMGKRTKYQLNMIDERSPNMFSYLTEE